MIGRPGFEGELKEGIPTGVARRYASDLPVHAKADKAGLCRDSTVKFPDRFQRPARIELQPVPEYCIGVRLLRCERIVVVVANFLDGEKLREGQIQNDARMIGAEIVDHLLFGEEGRLRVPDLFLLGDLVVGAEDVAATRAPMRMTVEDFEWE